MAISTPTTQHGTAAPNENVHMTGAEEEGTTAAPPPAEDLYSKPVPRGPRSPARRAEVAVRNRRREYLQRHPSYYAGLEHELAGT